MTSPLIGSDRLAGKFRPARTTGHCAISQSERNCPSVVHRSPINAAAMSETSALHHAPRHHRVMRPDRRKTNATTLRQHQVTAQMLQLPVVMRRLGVSVRTRLLLVCLSLPRQVPVCNDARIAVATKEEVAKRTDRAERPVHEKILEEPKPASPALKPGIKPIVFAPKGDIVPEDAGLPDVFKRAFKA